MVWVDVRRSYFRLRIQSRSLIHYAMLAWVLMIGWFRKNQTLVILMVHIKNTFFKALTIKFRHKMYLDFNVNVFKVWYCDVTQEKRFYQNVWRRMYRKLDVNVLRKPHFPMERRTFSVHLVEPLSACVYDERPWSCLWTLCKSTPRRV